MHLRQAPREESEGPAHENLAHACCGRWAADRTRFALYHDEFGAGSSAWTFWDIQREANRLSNVLAALGVARGECVAVAAGQRPEIAVTHIACYQMGAAVLPLSAALDMETLAFVLDRAAPRVAIVDAPTLQRLAAVHDRLSRRVHVVAIGSAEAPWARKWAEVLPLAAARYAAAGTPDDAALWLADTDPAVPRVPSQRALLQAAAKAAVHGSFPQPEDLFWSTADWTGMEGLCGGLLAAWNFGRPILGYSGAFDPEKAFWLIERYGVSSIFLSPSQLALMMAAAPAPKAKYALELRSVACGGAVAQPVAAWALEELGVVVEENLGNEETEHT